MPVFLLRVSADEADGRPPPLISGVYNIAAIAAQSGQFLDQMRHILICPSVSTIFVNGLAVAYQHKGVEHSVEWPGNDAFKASSAAADLSA